MSEGIKRNVSNYENGAKKLNKTARVDRRRPKSERREGSRRTGRGTRGCEGRKVFDSFAVVLRGRSGRESKRRCDKRDETMMMSERRKAV